MLNFSLYIASFNLNQIIYFKYIYYNNKQFSYFNQGLWVKELFNHRNTK